MGCCCSHPASIGSGSEVADCPPPCNGRKDASPCSAVPHNKTTAPQHAATTKTHRIGHRDSSGSTTSLTGMAAAIDDAAKGLEATQGPRSSSDNATSQPLAVSAGCSQRPDGQPSRRPPPREGDGSEVSDGTRLAFNGALPASQPQASTAPALAPFSAMDGGGQRRIPAVASQTSCSSAAGRRRSPRQALLSYADQYRALQPYLRPHLRNRRWRLVYSSDANTSHLMERCLRVFREEEALWQAASRTKLPRSVSGQSMSRSLGSSGHSSAAAREETDEGDSGAAASAAFNALPVIALMETEVVVRAPVHSAAVPSPVSEEPSAALPAGPSVVDSHVCLGLYMQHRPAADAVTTYRRSELFFFLFQSPIQASSAAAEVAGETPLGRPAEYSAPQPAVSAPPPSATQINRQTSNEGEGRVGAAAGTNPRDRRSLSPPSSSSPSKPTRTPRTQTHRVGKERVQRSASSYGGNSGDSTAVFRPEDEMDSAAGDASPSPPRVSFTNAGRRGRPPQEEVQDASAFAWENDEAAAYHRRSSETDGQRGGDPPPVRENTSRGSLDVNTAPTAAHQERQSAISLESHASSRYSHSFANEAADAVTAQPSISLLNGIVSAEWQQQVEALQHGEAKHPNPTARTSEGWEKTRQTHAPGIAINDSERKVAGDEEEDTFSASSAPSEPEEATAVGVTSEPHWSGARRPPPLQLASSTGNPSQAGSRTPERARSPPVVHTAVPAMRSGLPAWAAGAANPQRVTGAWLAAAADNATQPSIPSDSAFADAPLSPSVIHPRFPAAWRDYAERGGAVPLLMDDDVVSASTTVVSATSVPGMAWRDDEDLSSYWPEGGGGLLSATYADGSAGQRQRGGRAARGGLWPSPGTGPQHPTLSRISSFTGEDTAECFTPQLLKDDGVSGESAFAAAEGDEEGHGAPAGVHRDRAPPLLGLMVASASAGRPAMAATAPYTHTGTLAVSAAAGPRDSIGGNSERLSAAAAAAADLQAPAGDGGGSVSVAAQSCRPVSTRVEVLLLKHVHPTALTERGEHVPEKGFLPSQPPSRTPSQLALMGGTVEVYCTSGGALYVWDPHTTRRRTLSDTLESDTPLATTAIGEETAGHEMIYQRDASGVRWNMDYFARRGYGQEADIAASSSTMSAPPELPPLFSSSSPSPFSPPTSACFPLFAYVQAQARERARATAAAAVAAGKEGEVASGGTGVLCSPLVKVQLCAISSRRMTTAFQSAPPSTATTAPAVAAFQ